MRHARSQGAALGKGKSADPDAVDLRKMEEKAKLNKAKASASVVSSSVDSGTSPTVRATAKPFVAEVGRTVGPAKPKVPPAPAPHARNKKNQAEMLGVRAPGWADEFGGKASNAAAKGRVTAVLGPTNTGKTYMAIERMVAHSSGIIGLPLRLLAREVYGKLVTRSARILWLCILARSESFLMARAIMSARLRRCLLRPMLPL